MDSTTSSVIAGQFRTSGVNSSLMNVTAATASNRTEDFNITLPNDVHIPTFQEKVSMIFNPVGIFGHVVCVAGLSANILSIAAVCNIPHKRYSHSKFILNLALSDILVIFSKLACDYMFIFTNYNCFIQLTSHFLTATALCALLANLLVMALDHYFAILYPFKYEQLKSNKRSVLIVISIWFTSVFIGLTDIIVAGSNGLNVCNFTEDSYQTWQPIIGIFFVTLFAIAYIYIRIYMVVRNMGLQDQCRLLSQNHDSKALWTTLMLVLTFVIGWLPHELSTIAQYIILDYYQEILQNESAFDLILTIHEICLTLILLNSLADPLIYGFRLQSVRDGYRILWFKMHRKNSSFINEVRFQNNQASRKRKIISSTFVSVPMPSGNRKLSIEEGETFT